MAVKWTGFYKIIQQQPTSSAEVTDNQQIGSPGSYGNYNWYHKIIQGSASRLVRYREWDLMDNDIDISRALDLIAEEMIGNNTKDDDPLILEVDDIDNVDVTNNMVATLKAALSHWSNIHDWDNRLFNLARYTVKYGDVFFRKDTSKARWTFIHPKDVISAVVNSEDVTDVQGWQIKNHLLDAKTSYGVPSSGVGGTEETEFYQASEIVRCTLNDDMSDNAPFGESVLRPVYRTFKQKELLEDAVVIYRIQRAPERRVFYIDVGKMPPQRIKQYLEQIKNEIKQKKIPTFNGNNSEIEAVYNPQSQNEDFFLAQRCISFNTLVPLLNGESKTLGELISDYGNGIVNWVYSVDKKTQKMIAGKISWAGATRKNAELVRVHFDNGEYLDCTPDHRLITRDGVEVEAQNLIGGDSMMPLYRKRVKTNKKQNESKYEMILDNSTGKYKYTHLEVCPKVDSNNVIHHINCNPSNNEPTNLVEMDKQSHWKLHSEYGHALGKLWKTDRTKMMLGIHNYWKNISDEKREHRANCSRANAKTGWVENREMFEKTLDVNRTKHKEKYSSETEYKEFMRSIAQNFQDNITTEQKTYQSECSARTNTKTKSQAINDDMCQRFLNVFDICESIKAKHLIADLHSDVTFMDLFKDCNINNFRVKRGDDVLFDTKFVKKLVNGLGYNTYQDFTKEYHRNHKVLRVELLDYKEDTGCLTIEDAGDNHNFAIGAGVYICNSDGKGSRIETLPGGQNLGSIEDLDYFGDKVFRGLRIPLSYMKEGDSGGAVFNDGKLGQSYIVELRFSLYVQRLQASLERVMDEEFKSYLKSIGINIDNGMFKIKLPEPSNFGKYREQEMDAALLGMFGSADALPYLAKKFSMKRYLKLTDEEILENERAKLIEIGENPDNYDPAVLAKIYSPESMDMGGDMGGMGGGDFGGGELSAGDMMTPEGGEGGADLGGAEAGAGGL